MEIRIRTLLSWYLEHDELPDGIDVIEAKKHIKGTFAPFSLEAGCVEKNYWWYTLKNGNTIRARGVVIV